jgi:hypothetical protein
VPPRPTGTTPAHTLAPPPSSLSGVTAPADPSTLHVEREIAVGPAPVPVSTLPEGPAIASRPPVRFWNAASAAFPSVATILFLATLATAVISVAGVALLARSVEFAAMNPLDQYGEPAAPLRQLDTGAAVALMAGTVALGAAIVAVWAWTAGFCVAALAHTTSGVGVSLHAAGRAGNNAVIPIVATWFLSSTFIGFAAGVYTSTNSAYFAAFGVIVTAALSLLAVLCVAAKLVDIARNPLR